MLKKWASIFFAVFFAAALLAGCGEKEKPAETGGEETQEEVQTESDVSDSVFTYAIAGDTGNTLNPLTADDRWGLMVNHLLYTPMYFINPDAGVDYILAESMDLSDDGLVYTMKLKEGLKWSDDTPLTAEDVVFTFEKINEQTQNLYVDGKPISLEKVDDLTVKFTLPSVSASAFEMLSAEISILPKHYFEGKNSFDVNLLEEKIVGSGPYVLEEYKTGQYLKFTKNPNYAMGEANIDTIVYRIIEKNDTASLALQNGDIDAWIALPDLLDPFENNEAFRVQNYSEGRVAYLRLNSASPNMQDKNYREGILQALDRSEIMKASYTDEDFYELGYSFLPFNNSYYSEDVEKWEQDIEKAKQKTEGGPKTLKICYIDEDTVQTNQALTIQTELKEIGIDLELVGVNWAAYMKTANDPADTTYDIYLGGYVMGVDPDAFSSLFMTSKDNMINFNSKEIDALFAKGNASLKEEERREIYNGLQRKVSEEAIFYPFGSNLRTLVTSVRVEGIEDAKLVPIYTFGDLSKLKLK